MIILSYNIRGGGIVSNRKRISYLLNSCKVDVCFLQETKITNFNDSYANSFWGRSIMDWTTSNSSGASGGMAILWMRGSLEPNYNFSGVGYVGINITWKGNSVNLVNIYAPYSVTARRDLWKDLVERKNKYGNDEWCLGGDFNEVTCREERLGGRREFQ